MRAGAGFFLPVAVFCMAACARDAATASSDVARDGAITAALDGSAIVIRNDADTPIGVAVVESEYARTALALWCFGSDECGMRVGARSSVRVPLVDVAGYSHGAVEVLIHWWRAAGDRPPGESAEVRKFALRI